MTETAPLRYSYAVTIPGSAGPCLRATFARTGVGSVATSSTFRVTAPDSVRVSEIAAMLDAQGLMILEIRQVAPSA